MSNDRICQKKKLIKYLLLFSQESKVVVTRFTVLFFVLFCFFFLMVKFTDIYRQTNALKKKNSQFPINVL